MSKTKNKILKELGLTEAEFYKRFPTKESYEQYKNGGNIPMYANGGQTYNISDRSINPYSVGYGSDNFAGGDPYSYNQQMGQMEVSNSMNTDNKSAATGVSDTATGVLGLFNPALGALAGAGKSMGRSELEKGQRVDENGNIDRSKAKSTATASAFLDPIGFIGVRSSYKGGMTDLSGNAYADHLQAEADKYKPRNQSNDYFGYYHGTDTLGAGFTDYRESGALNPEMNKPEYANTFSGRNGGFIPKYAYGSYIDPYPYGYDTGAATTSGYTQLGAGTPQSYGVLNPDYKQISPTTSYPTTLNTIPAKDVTMDADALYGSPKVYNPNYTQISPAAPSQIPTMQSKSPYITTPQSTGLGLAVPPTPFYQSSSNGFNSSGQSGFNTAGLNSPTISKVPSSTGISQSINTPVVGQPQSQYSPYTGFNSNAYNNTKLTTNTLGYNSPQTQLGVGTGVTPPSEYDHIDQAFADMANAPEQKQKKNINWEGIGTAVGTGLNTYLAMENSRKQTQAYLDYLNSRKAYVNKPQPRPSNTKIVRDWYNQPYQASEYYAKDGAEINTQDAIATVEDNEPVTSKNKPISTDKSQGTFKKIGKDSYLAVGATHEQGGIPMKFAQGGNINGEKAFVFSDTLEPSEEFLKNFKY